ncbi:MAG: arsenate reductase family protein [Rikenellaceae bacterium]
MKVKILCYSGCSTCKKALKWLKDNSVEFENREITIDNPTSKELNEWIELSDKPVTKFFNTSGKKYKELGLKDVVKSATQNELIELLSSDGMLVKRPILVGDNRVLVGFKEAEWSELLLCN